MSRRSLSMYVVGAVCATTVLTGASAGSLLAAVILMLLGLLIAFGVRRWWQRGQQVATNLPRPSLMTGRYVWDPRADGRYTCRGFPGHPPLHREQITAMFGPALEIAYELTGGES